MPLFRYEIVDNNGRQMFGAMDASSEVDVQHTLTSRGFRVLRVIPTASVPTTAPRPSAPAVSRPAVSSTVRTSRRTAPKKELAIFFRQLSQLLNAGVGLHQSLSQIAAQTPNHSMRVIAADLSSKVLAGGQLNQGMMEYPRAFPKHIVGVVAAAELGGLLPVILGDIALDYELSLRASNRIIRMISWALWVNTAGLVILTPFFSSMLKGENIDMISILGRWWRTISHVSIPAVILVFGVYHTAAYCLRQPRMHRLASRLVLKVPWAGKASKERSLASFSRILWRLQNAGILPVQAWIVASRVPENAVIADALEAQTEAIRTDLRFSEALARARVFSPDDLRVLAVAEQTGATADSLSRISAHYEDAAMVSAGRARWLGLRAAILATILGVGYLWITIALHINYTFTWVDKYFGLE